jgi:hypothetical protein
MGRHGQGEGNRPVLHFQAHLIQQVVDQALDDLLDAAGAPSPAAPAPPVRPLSVTIIPSGHPLQGMGGRGMRCQPEFLP